VWVYRSASLLSPATDARGIDAHLWCRRLPLRNLLSPVTLALPGASRLIPSCIPPLGEAARIARLASPTPTTPIG